jgi:hypothetical protein
MIEIAVLNMVFMGAVGFGCLSSVFAELSKQWIIEKKQTTRANFAQRAK